MKIGPDGSLPRITSSFKGLTSNLRIAKVSDDQIDESGMVYKLVLTGNEESETSEKSDGEEWSEEDIPNIQLPQKDKEDSIDFCSNKLIEDSRPQNVDSGIKHKGVKTHRQNYKRNYHVKRDLNASGAFNNPNLIVPSNEERNSFNSSKRGFGSSGNYRRTYNQPLQNTGDIEVWNRQPAIVLPPPNFQFPPYVYDSAINHQVQTSPYSVIENPAITIPNSFGLLGNSPSDFFSRPPNYQPSTPNDVFMGGQNYFDHPNHYGNFQGPAHPHHESMHRQPNQKKFNNDGFKQWRGKNNRQRRSKNNQQHNRWNRQKSYGPQKNEKRNESHFDFRK